MVKHFQYRVIQVFWGPAGDHYHINQIIMQTPDGSVRPSSSADQLVMMIDGGDQFIVEQDGVDVVVQPQKCRSCDAKVLPFEPEHPPKLWS